MATYCIQKVATLPLKMGDVTTYFSFLPPHFFSLIPSEQHCVVHIFVDGLGEVGLGF